MTEEAGPSEGPGPRTQQGQRARHTSKLRNPQPSRPPNLHHSSLPQHGHPSLSPRQNAGGSVLEWVQNAGATGHSQLSWEWGTTLKTGGSTKGLTLPAGPLTLSPSFSSSAGSLAALPARRLRPGVPTRPCREPKRMTPGFATYTGRPVTAQGGPQGQIALEGAPKQRSCAYLVNMVVKIAESLRKVFTMKKKIKATKTRSLERRERM